MPDSDPTASHSESFAALDSAAADPAAMLHEFAGRCAAQRDWPRLFEVRLMQARQRLGLPVDCTLLSDQAAAQREQLEADYHAACLEAGDALLADNRPAQAWAYLRAAGEQQRMAEGLRRLTPAEEDHEELIQLALHEQAAPLLGFRWMLQWFGTCNAVTALGGLAGYLPPEDFQACAGELVEWLHRELTDSVLAHVKRQEPAAVDAPLAELMQGRPWLFEHESSHVDASHLGSAVGWSRLLTDARLLGLAQDLAGYGAQLNESQQYPQAPPFEATYPAHLHWLGAVQGSGVDEALSYFRSQVDEHPDEYSRPACVEAYIELLAKTGRAEQALHAMQELVAPADPLPEGAPTPLELARESGAWGAYDKLVRQRGDSVGYAAGLIARRG